MKKVVLLILFLGISYHLFAQTITRAEYFINNDPGYGLGETIPILSQTSLDLVLPLDTLSSGLHTFYVRVLKDDNLWSQTQAHTFFKTDGLLQAEIVQVEYFIDEDPGFGQATTVAIGAPSSEKSLTLDIPLEELSAGLHTLYVRAKADNGHWSTTQTHTFFKTNGLLEHEITKVEYFIDNDPGYGLGTNIPLDTQTNELTQALTIPLSSIATGLHTLYVRSKSDNGHWSNTASHIFFVTQGSSLKL